MHNIDGVLVRFIRHDKARNYINASYSTIGWILMLGSLLDYMHNVHVNVVVSSFSKLIRWHNSPIIKVYVLVKCMYNSTLDVPDQLCE